MLLQKQIFSTSMKYICHTLSLNFFIQIHKIFSFKFYKDSLFSYFYGFSNPIHCFKKKCAVKMVNEFPCLRFDIENTQGYVRRNLQSIYTYFFSK